MYAKNVGTQNVHIKFNQVDRVLAPGQAAGSFGLAISGTPYADYPSPPPPPAQPSPPPPSGDAGRPTHFSINYTFQPSPGIRDWTRASSGVWTERYPNGATIITHREIGRTTIDGCYGTLVSTVGGAAGFQTYIPDKGCQMMWARFRQGNGAWSFFGEMHDIL
jgi:hypothetical protein